MDPIIYVIPKIDEIIELNTKNFRYGQKPSPRLLKYGFNNITEQLDLETITSVEQYRAGLNFDFENNNENSISTKLSILFKVKNIDITFAEFWEILILFGLLKKDQNIYTSNAKTMNDITNAYLNMSDTKNKYNITDSEKTKSGISLVVYKYADSNVDIDENVGAQLLSNNLTDLISMQNKGASMIIQLFGMQTQISAEFIYYLSSLYNEAYLIKPIVSSDLSNSRYIVLIGLKDSVSIIPFKSKSKNNTYLKSIGLTHIPVAIENVIQCMNAKIIPMRYNTYNKIKEYLNTKVYEGATYKQMIQTQYENADKWSNLFSNLNRSEQLLNATLKNSTDSCRSYSELFELLG